MREILILKATGNYNVNYVLPTLEENFAESKWRESKINGLYSKASLVIGLKHGMSNAAKSVFL